MQARDSIPNEIFFAVFSSPVNFMPSPNHRPTNTTTSIRNLPLSLQIFVRTVLARPILANYVRSVDLDWEYEKVDVHSNPQYASDIAL